MAQILVTGAFGFIGRHVAKLAAAKGNIVAGIGHGDWRKDEWLLWGLSSWHSADVSYKNICKYCKIPDIIIHCATASSVPFSYINPALDFRKTVLSTLGILEYMRLQAPSAKLVFTSSAAVYGNASQFPIPPSAPRCPVSPYGFNKKVAEDLCMSYSDFHGIRALFIRLFSVYGPGLKKQLLWDACNKLSAGNPDFFGTGNETRDWLHVYDAASLLVGCALNPYPSENCFNGGSGDSPTVRQVLELVNSELQTGLSLAFSGKTPSGDPSHYQADISSASKIGWQPIFDWKQGIKAYVSWYKTLSI